MVNDSVREELAHRISPRTKAEPKIIEEKVFREEISAPLKLEIMNEPENIMLIVESPIDDSKEISLPTDKFFPKTTSPILVEFQNRNAVIPEWRLKLQNSVRRRSGQLENALADAPKILVTNGATALKVEPVEQPTIAVSANPTLEKALERIEKSRQRYLTEEKPKAQSISTPPKSFPYIVANRTPTTFPINKVQNSEKSSVEANFGAAEYEKFDTNKLPPIPVKIASAFEKKIEISSAGNAAARENNVIKINAESPDVLAYTESTLDEIAPSASHETAAEGDDRAPMMLRFNAGFFDLIIGAFTSFILLAPFTLASGNLFSFQGLLAFLATCSIVMFIYLTATIGTMGRTFGMKIFSLEIIDVEENVYPSFHQAAVSSSVYLVSLALGGVGFLTLFLNDENRAAHDLISGTIVVKEYE